MADYKILVPVDFSPCSREAYRNAVILARKFKGDLLILHVVDSRIIEPLAGASSRRGEDLMNELYKKARARIRDFLSGHPSRIKARRVIVTGVPFNEIVKTARMEKADLIVMGRYGGTGELEKIFFGSTVEKVVRVAPCAVLSIPLIEEAPKK
ncbi:MAG TPA: universal stress protein [Nitrospiria bacterium]|nr:universal stress protein [Nitrospiria bacterium]